MKLIQLQVENTFIKGNKTSQKLGTTVYERSFRKLIVQSGSLGKIHPIYLKLKNRYVIFGILTMNEGGSYSFFPELPGEYKFDHLTFSKDLVKGNHHYTRQTFWGREKVLPIYAQLLTNGIYHAVSFTYKDFALLKDVPKYVNYPSVNQEDLKHLSKAFITSGQFEGSTHIECHRTDHAICIQFFLIPKGINPKNMAPFDVDLAKGTPLQYFYIPHEFQDDYRLGIASFPLHKNVMHPLSIVSKVKQQGFYSKIDILKK